MAGKKKRMQGKTVDINDFLVDEVQPAPGEIGVNDKNLDWAAEVELSGAVVRAPSFSAPKPRSSEGYQPKQAALPSGPRSTRQGTSIVDLNKIPPNGPYVCFLGNMSYDAGDEDVRHFFRNFSVKNVRLMTDDNGRLKGFCYVEFNTRNDLIEAIESMSGQLMFNREVRLDIADQDQILKYRGQRPDQTPGNWRGSTGSASQAPNRQNSYGGGESDWRRAGDSVSTQRGGYPDRRYNPPAPYGQPSGMPYDGYPPPPPGGAQYSVPVQYPPGPPAGYATLPRSGRDSYEDPSSYDSRGGYADRNRQYGGGGRAGYGGDYGGNRDRGGPRRGNDFVGHNTYDRRGQRSERYSSGSSFRDEPRRFEEGDRRASHDQPEYYQRQRTESTRSSPPPGSESGDTHRERPKLALLPRSKPIEEKVAEETPPSAPAGTGGSIFGAAKPVDTAARERAMEEKLQKEKEKIEHELHTGESRKLSSSGPQPLRINTSRRNTERTLSQSSSGYGAPKSPRSPGILSTQQNPSEIKLAPQSSLGPAAHGSLPRSSSMENAGRRISESMHGPPNNHVGGSSGGMSQSVSEYSMVADSAAGYVSAPLPSENAWGRSRNAKEEAPRRKSSDEQQDYLDVEDDGIGDPRYGDEATQNSKENSYYGPGRDNYALGGRGFGGTREYRRGGNGRFQHAGEPPSRGEGGRARDGVSSRGGMRGGGGSYGGGSGRRGGGGNQGYEMRSNGYEDRPAPRSSGDIPPRRRGSAENSRGGNRNTTRRYPPEARESLPKVEDSKPVTYTNTNAFAALDEADDE